MQDSSSLWKITSILSKILSSDQCLFSSGLLWYNFLILFCLCLFCLGHLTLGFPSEQEAVKAHSASIHPSIHPPPSTVLFKPASERTNCTPGWTEPELCAQQNNKRLLDPDEFPTSSYFPLRITKLWRMGPEGLWSLLPWEFQDPTGQIPK